ncbi:MAG: hypothetical protein M3R17_16060 [Bacteroidota bacterium]|nr:hypothetical protein [Bacteroidota bacterium]
MAPSKRPGDNLIATLKKSIVDLEDFQVQLALGKAEATDKYEDVKKKFNRFLHTTKVKYLTGTKAKVLGEFEELQVQLALGKADSLDTFNTQKKKIFSAISKLEKLVQNESRAINKEVAEGIHHEIEKFRIKLEVLRVHYESGKMDVKEEFETRKHEMAESVARLKTRFNVAVSAQKRQERHQVLKKAYRDMKKTFVKA